MKNVCMTFIGTKETANLLGVKATVSDLEFRHYTKGDKILTWVRPLGSEKIKTVIQAVNLGEQVVIEVEAVDRFLGELIVLLELLGKETIFLLKSDKAYLQGQIEEFLNGTKFLSAFRIINDNEDYKTLKEDLIQVEASYESETLIVLDHYFNVKNVGTVALGFVRGGVIKAKDKIKLWPGGRDVQVNSLQSMDVNYKEIGFPARVGLALKNCDIKDLERGSILSNVKSETSELNGEVKFSKYFKGELKSAMIINGLLARQAEFKEKIILEKPIVLNGPTIIYKDDISPRIIGIIK